MDTQGVALIMPAQPNEFSLSFTKKGAVSVSEINFLLFCATNLVRRFL